MNKLMTGLAVTGLALTAMVATPAFAQSNHHAGNSMHMSQNAYDSYAAAGPVSAWNYPNSVFVDGEYRGTDPDPTIRLQLERQSAETQN
jgi:hypothetical protein